MKDCFIPLFHYHHEMNDRVISMVGNEPGAALSKLISHTLNAELIWVARIRGENPAVAVWQEHPPSSFAMLNAAAHRASMQLLEEETDDRVVEYATSSGQRYKSLVSDILFHVVNHGTYHRGQIMQLWAATGGKPAITDYIFSRRTPVNDDKKADI